MNQGQLRAVLGYLQRVANPDGGGPGDSQLLDRWREQRDPAAFELLVWRHGSMVWNVCRRILGREQDVEDAFQATFLTFVRKAKTIGQGRFLNSWLYKVAYRTALATRTTSKRHSNHEPLDIDLPATLNDDGWDQLAPLLDEEVNRLPEKYRRPFVLCYLEGKTTDEAAEDLGCPRGTVGTRLAWARKRLCSRLTRRGLALSATALGALLAEQATASVSAPLVAIAVKAASFSASKQAVAAGVITAHAAALSQQILRSLFVTRVKSAVVTLWAVGLLGIGTGLPAHRAFTGDGAQQQTVQATPSVACADEKTPPTTDVADKANAVEPPIAKQLQPPLAPDKGGKELPQQLTGTVVRVDNDGTIFGLEVRSKIKGDAAVRVDIKLSERTQVVFNNIGPNDAKLMAGYGADVWLEKDNRDVAARVHFRGTLNPKSAPNREGQVVGIEAGSITLARPGKVEPVEPIAVQLTDQTRVSFANVGRDGATITPGYEGRAWLKPNSRDIAKSVTFIGAVENKALQVKEPKNDRSGRIVGVSDDGQVLTVEIPPSKGKEASRVEIKLTDATRESYHDVPADGAKPVVGYQVQVWLMEGSQGTATRVRFSRGDPRPSIDARILAVSEDGNRFTVAVPVEIKGGEPLRREIQTTPRTRLGFFNVGPDGARLTEGYHVRGWLAEASDDVADELIVSRMGKGE